MIDNDLNWLASRVFTDEHYGKALTNDEMSRILALEEEYKDEIGMAKLMLENNPNFLDLSYEKKIEMAGNLIKSLREKRDTNSSKKL